MIETLQYLIGGTVMILGLIFMFIGSVGIVRLPDFYARTHAASKVDTVGIIVMLAGIAVIEGLTLNSAKIVLAMVFLTITNPVAVHALARAAMRLNIKPWKAEEKD